MARCGRADADEGTTRKLVISRSKRTEEVRHEHHSTRSTLCRLRIADQPPPERAGVLSPSVKLPKLRPIPFANSTRVVLHAQRPALGRDVRIADGAYGLQLGAEGGGRESNDDELPGPRQDDYVPRLGEAASKDPGDVVGRPQDHRRSR